VPSRRPFNDDGADANGRSATCRPWATVRIREDGHGTVGWALHWIAEELSRRMLLVLTRARSRGTPGEFPHDTG
jgi:hypothetical protein